MTVLSRISKKVCWKSGKKLLVAYNVYYSTESNTEPIFDETNPNNVVPEPLFDDMISLAEVQRAVKTSKNNKASGADSIPVEVY